VRGWLLASLDGAKYMLSNSSAYRAALARTYPSYTY
jgi:hypothetical protein